MVPWKTQTDTNQATHDLKLVCAEAETIAPAEPKVEARSKLRPELRAAADASWARNEAAIRYLGR